MMVDCRRHRADLPRPTPTASPILRQPGRRDYGSDRHWLAARRATRRQAGHRCQQQGRPRALSKNRSLCRHGVSNSEATLRRMCLYWGVFPVRNAPTGDATGLLEYVISRTQEISRVGKGDRVVLVTGTRLLDKGHNVIVVHEVE